MSGDKLSTLIPRSKPFEFEGLDIRPSFRANDSGAHTYSVNIMVTEQMWNSLKTIPRHRMIGGILFWYEDENEIPPKTTEQPPIEQPASQDDAFAFGVKQEPAEHLPLPEPEPRKPGKWGDFWKELYAYKFMNNAPLIHHLKVSGKGDTVKIALRARLNITSLTDCSPDHLGAWLTQKIRQGADLRGAKEIADRVLEKLGGVEYKWGKKEKEDAA